MKELKVVYVTYMEGMKSRTRVISDVKRINISKRFLEITYADSQVFVLKLECLVFYTSI